MSGFACQECGNVIDDIEQDCEVCGASPNVARIGNQNFMVVNAITAHLEKEKIFEFTMGQLWNLTTPVATEFITRIEKKFRRKNKFHNYLVKDTLPNSIPTLLSKFNAGTIIFETLCQSVMNKLKLNSNNENVVSKLVGGTLVFVHYKSINDADDLGKLLIVMVDKRGAFDFEEGSLQPKRLNPVNTDALRQAAMFDLTLFDECYPDNNGHSYVDFIQGKSQSDVFKDSLGCTRDVDNKRSINEIFRAIEVFVSLNSLGRAVRENADIAVRNFLDIKSRDNVDKSVSIDEIQEVIDKCLPKKSKYRSTFKDFVNENEFKIDAQFEPTIYSAKQALTIKLTDEDQNFEIKILRGAIGDENSNKPVIIGKRNNEVIIRLSPEEFNKLKKYADE
ncbi:nucleoid-associated protein [Enterobacter ludwigii]|uniref:nucleoid-associated protein n=1 Tax=Enterobacter TaxID=547 RepID=UPI001DE77688|nr:nucleoid-associated protein [Enterobacter ludwigii]MBS6013162.1 nucleoid-associated protein [Enterobacter cloacae]WGA06419.1 nucleoid-associated protein [Enterobacter ludwigii]